MVILGAGAQLPLQRQLGHLSKASGAERVGEGKTKLPGFFRIAVQAAKMGGNPRQRKAGGWPLEAGQAHPAVGRVKGSREVGVCYGGRRQEIQEGP